MDVENFDGVRRHPIENPVRIPNEGNHPNAGALCNLPRALGLQADSPLDGMEGFVGIDNPHFGRCFANTAATSPGATNR